MKLILTFAVLTQISMSFGCRDINITIVSVKNCIKNPVMTVQDNFLLKLNEKCVLSIDSCYDFKPFKKSSAELVLFKGKKRQHSEKIEMCNRNKKGKEITEYILLGLGLNINCPVTNETTYCSRDRKVYDFNPMMLRLAKAMFPEPELIKIKMTFTHDTGKSCLDVDFKIVFPK